MANLNFDKKYLGTVALWHATDGRICQRSKLDTHDYNDNFLNDGGNV